MDKLAEIEKIFHTVSIPSGVLAECLSYFDPEEYSELQVSLSELDSDCFKAFQARYFNHIKPEGVDEYLNPTDFFKKTFSELYKAFMLPAFRKDNKWLNRILKDLNDSSKILALYLAAKNGHKDIVEFLLEVAGADIAAKDKGLALSLANKNGYMDIAKFLLEMDLSDEEKIIVLKKHTAATSVGIIISAGTFESQKHTFSDLEFIPYFRSKEDLAPIRCSLKQEGTYGPTYDALSAIQKKWLKEDQAGGRFISGFRRPHRRDECKYVPYYKTINIRHFENTSCQFIAIELLSVIGVTGEEYIGLGCISQMLRIIDYAYEHGEKKIIIINNTKLTHADIFEKIKTEMLKYGKMSTASRLDNMIFSEELAKEARKKIKIMISPLLFLKLNEKNIEGDKQDNFEENKELLLFDIKNQGKIWSYNRPIYNEVEEEFPKKLTNSWAL